MLELVGAAISIGADILGGSQSANAGKDLARYQQEQLERNAKYAEEQAVLTEKKGQETVGSLARAGKQQVGSQRAGYAAQGIDVDTGSAAEVQQSTGELTAQDMGKAKANGWREAMGYRVQAEDYRAQGRMKMMAAEKEAESTLLTSGLKAFDKGREFLPGSSGGGSGGGSGKSSGGSGKGGVTRSAY